MFYWWNFWDGGSIETVPGDDLSVFGDPDHVTKRAGDRKQPAKTADGDTVGGTAVERMIGEGGPGDARAFSFERQRG